MRAGLLVRFQGVWSLGSFFGNRGAGGGKKGSFDGKKLGVFTHTT